MDFALLPKVELHLHLDCSLSYELVSQIEPGISRDAYQEQFIAPAKCIDLADYLLRANRAISLMQSKDHLEMVVDDLFRQLQEDNLIYVEIRFAPFLHTQKGLTPYEVVKTVNQRVQRCQQNSGIEARLILCTLRHYSEEQSMETVQLVETFKGTAVTGFDLASDEFNFPIDKHIRAFQYAQQHGLHRTAHAGEARGADSVWETLRNFQPSRIGHGVRSIEDPELLDFIREKGIHLEVCPTSNIQTNVFDTMEDHPIDQLYQSGISVGINTDARAISNVSLEDEYRTLHQQFGWGKEEILQCNLNAMEVAFVEEEVKERIMKKLVEGYNQE